MMIYLLAIGSPTHPVAPEYWNNFSRPIIHYKEFNYISGDDPLFTHQYSQAWFDFRNKRDAYANYFENSVTATRAHKAFCLSYPQVVQRGLLGRFGIRLCRADTRHGADRRRKARSTALWFLAPPPVRWPFLPHRLHLSSARHAIEMGQDGLGTLRICRRLSSRSELV